MTENRELREIVQTMKASIRANEEGFKQMVKSVNQVSLTLAKSLHPSNNSSSDSSKKSGPIGNEVPVTIDWESPAIIGIGQFHRGSDGGTILVVDVESYDSPRLQEMIESGFAKGLTISSVDPD